MHQKHHAINLTHHHSHRSWSKCLRQYQAELLLRLRWMLVLLPCRDIFLLPVSFSHLIYRRNRAHKLQSETKQKTLEEIAAAFGDKVVLLTEIEVAAEEAIMDGSGGKARDEQVESIRLQ